MHPWKTSTRPPFAMLFIIAEKEEYFDNKDHAIKAHDRARAPRSW